jgi:DNA-binding transcriptional LysR family regulator
LRATQPALSRQIRHLEHAVGNALFIRHRNGLLLTATGAALREQGAKVLEAVEVALRGAREAEKRPVAAVRLGYYGSSVWDKVIAPALDIFGRKFPDVTLNIVEEPSVHLVNGLREGRIDVALLGSGKYDAIPGIVTEPACAVPAMVVVAANHRIAKRRWVSLADLRHDQIIGLRQEDAPGRYRTFITACRDVGFVPRIEYVATNFPELTMAVKKRMGVAIISSFATNVPHPGVVFIKVKPCVPLEIYAAHASCSPPVVRHLAAVIIGRARCAAQQVGGPTCVGVEHTPATV